jgi:hypothetical protein
MNPNTALLIIFGVFAFLAAIGIVLILTDKGLKWKDRP